jgi:hypothetical protein
MRNGDELLFHKYDLRKVIESQEEKISSEIEGYDRNYILNVSVEDLCAHLQDKFQISPLTLHQDKIYVKQHGDAQIDVSHDYNRVIFERDGPFYIKGTSVTFSIPFEGDSELFYCRASSFTMNPPRASVSNNEVLVNFQEVDPNPAQIKQEFARRISDIEQHVGYVNKDLKPFNDGLRAKIMQKINARREKLLKDQGMVAALGYPMREALDVPKTYAAPSVQRKTPVPNPQATTSPYVPEPTLDNENYEAIIKIISDMVLVIERSPHAFKDMKEEDLRQHFLVQLNGHYQGTAAGETFNFTGKTDILIRDNGRNIFIAECMFWQGQKSLTEKIDQLLGYVSWRDTKTAILVFNKNKEFSKVLEQIPEIVKQHKNYKRQLEYKHETGYRFILHQANDKNREFVVTVLAFDIPTGSSKEAEVES